MGVSRSRPCAYSPQFRLVQSAGEVDVGASVPVAVHILSLIGVGARLFVVRIARCNGVVVHHGAEVEVKRLLDFAVAQLVTDAGGVVARTLQVGISLADVQRV